MVARVTLVEAVGPSGVEEETEFLHLLGIDAHSAERLYYALYALKPDLDGSPVYSWERWCRFKFEPTFTYVTDFYFWVPGLVVPTGWTIRYGSTDTYRQPTNSPSVIAVNELPTSKPEAPNVGGLTPLDGSEVRYSDWIVLQASVSGDAALGPMLGFEGAEPDFIEYRFDWTES